jgi:tetratricopeptide (TPR) repeat protein
MHGDTVAPNGTQKSTLMKILQSPAVHLLILTMVALIAYSNTLHVPFILDDEGSIQLHTPVHGLTNFFKDGAGYNFLPNRAFGYLTFALNYEFGGLNVTGYHVVNLVIHISAGLLVYTLVRLTFRTPFLQCDQEETPAISLFAFVVALLFVCHPIQTQAVTYIAQRLTSLTTMLYLAATVCYLRWRLSLEQANFSPAAKRITWYILALGATVLAMKTKEISFTLPIVILLYEWTFFGRPTGRLLVQLAPLVLTLAIIPVTTYRHLKPGIEAAGGGSFLSDTATTTYDVIRVTRWEYLYTQFSVIVTYLRLLLFPVNQNLDYDYPINHSAFEPRAFLSLLMLATLFSTALYMYAKSGRARAINGCQQAPSRDRQMLPSSTLLRLAGFGILWFFITLSVESSIITILDVIYEHRVYLPSFGFFLSATSLVTLGLNRFQNRTPWLRELTFTSVACIMLILSVATYSRNSVWGNWLTLWSDNVAKSPNKPRPHNILGIGYYYIGKFDEAMWEYNQAVRLKPDFIDAYYNIALLHYARKEHKEAISVFLKVLGLSAFNATRHARAYNEIGINYSELGDREQALRAFASAVKYEPESAEFRNNYAFALSTTGNIDEAVRQYQKALQLDPGNPYAMEALQNIRP